MTDLYFTENGDIRVSATGDIALTETPYREAGQNAHIRIMTATGDFTLYPRLGADLHELFGMPQSEATGEYGKRLIQAALEREGVFSGQSININAVPTSPTAIRFDVYIKTVAGTSLLLSIEKDLTTQEI